jgi:hypothetical protein
VVHNRHNVRRVPISRSRKHAASPAICSKWRDGDVAVAGVAEQAQVAQ